MKHLSQVQIHWASDGSRILMRNQTQCCVWAFQRPLITFRPVGGDRSVHCALTGLGQIVEAFPILKFQGFGGKQQEEPLLSGIAVICRYVADVSTAGLVNVQHALCPNKHTAQSCFTDSSFGSESVSACLSAVTSCLSAVSPVCLFGFGCV